MRQCMFYMIQLHLRHTLAECESKILNVLGSYRSQYDFDLDQRW